MTRFIDLSIPITNTVVSDPPVMRPQITYMTHETTWEQIAMFFPGLTKGDLPNGEGWAVESITLSTHNGRSEEHTSELQSLMRISYAVFCLKNKTNTKKRTVDTTQIGKS